jgi:hypothetical protein
MMRDPRLNFGALTLLPILLACAGCADQHHAAPSRSPATDGAGRAGLDFVPDFPGAGRSGADEPLVGGMICDSVVSTASTKIVRPRTQCFFQTGQTQPAATIEQVLECAEGLDAVHLRLTFDPAFVDNTYGANAIGWNARGGPGDPGGPGGAGGPGGPGAPPPPAAMPGGPGAGPGMMSPPPPPAAMAGKGPKGGMGMGMGPGKGPGKSGHSWMDLVGSDHAEFVVTNDDGDLVAQFKLDYISESASAPSGYESLGVLGGDGRMIVGDANDILDWHTSIERNLNERGYGDFIIDSPETDADYTPNDDTPNWDYRVVYEVWIDDAAFGPSGFGGALIEHVHASPSKAPSNTIIVIPGECPCQRDGGCGDTPPPPTTCTPEHPDDFHCATGEVPPPPAKPDSCKDRPDDLDCALL